MDPSSGSVNDKHAARDHHQGPAQIDIELPPRHLFSTKQSALSPAKGPLPATSERVVHNLRLSHAHEICHLDDQSGLTVNGGPIANVADGSLSSKDEISPYVDSSRQHYMVKETGLPGFLPKMDIEVAAEHLDKAVVKPQLPVFRPLSKLDNQGPSAFHHYQSYPGQMTRDGLRRVSFARDSIITKSGHVEEPRMSASDLFVPTKAPMTVTPPSTEDRSRLKTLLPGLKALYELDSPKPEPYNSAYPHPISAYASPGVNPAALAMSGYESILDHLLKNDRDKLKGSILAGAGRGDVLPPALTMVILPGEGNGIPERLWTRFESLGAARLQVGAANAGPFARVEPTSGSFAQTAHHDGIHAMPPRFAAAHARMWPTELAFTDNRFDQPSFDDIQSNFQQYRIQEDQSSASMSSENSPWYKTELCPVFEDTGLCKFGKACQYAHGIDELRLPSTIVPLPTPPLESRSLDEGYFPQSAIPCPQERRQTTPSYNPKLDQRRSSFSPMDIFTGGKADEESSPWDHANIAPIGSERDSPYKQRSKRIPAPLKPEWEWRSFDFDLFAEPTPRPTRTNTDVTVNHNSPPSAASSWTSENITLGWSSFDQGSDLSSSYDNQPMVRKSSEDRWPKPVEGLDRLTSMKSIWS